MHSLKLGAVMAWLALFTGFTCNRSTHSFCEITNLTSASDSEDSDVLISRSSKDEFCRFLYNPSPAWRGFNFDCVVDLRCHSGNWVAEAKFRHCDFSS